MNRPCSQCKNKRGIIGDKTLFCEKCGNLLTESLFINENEIIEISKIAINRIHRASERITINIAVETDKHNKVIAIHYPDLDFILGKILK